VGEISSRAAAGGALAHARDGDRAAFDQLVAPFWRELHAHRYRMLGSSDDADDALQDALLRAWRGLVRFEGRSSLRSWLHAVVTRACLDAIQERGRRAMPVDLGPSSERAVVGDAPRTDVGWIGPYPDDAAAPADPGAQYEQREAVELAFVSALQHLPGNQRAALLLFEVAGLSAAEIAAAMDTTTASVNSALQRARRLVAERVPSPSQQESLRRLGDVRMQEIVRSYAAALEHGYADRLVTLLTEDVIWSMPPLPHWYRGIGPVMDFVVQVPMTRCGSWWHRPIAANGQPAVACYLRPKGDDNGPHRAWSINVLRLRGERIAEVVSFVDARHFPLFGLPAALP
jgi:RNA polymerase sigma-70 factor, ECF subfamily